MTGFYDAVEAACKEQLADEETREKVARERLEADRALFANVVEYLDNPAARAGGFEFEHWAVPRRTSMDVNFSGEHIFFVKVEGFISVGPRGGEHKYFLTLDEAKPYIIALTSARVDEIRQIKAEAAAMRRPA